jgi:hypothetical protein
MKINDMLIENIVKSNYDYIIYYNNLSEINTILNIRKMNVVKSEYISIRSHDSESNSEYSHYIDTGFMNKNYGNGIRINLGINSDLYFPKNIDEFKLEIGISNSKKVLGIFFPTDPTPENINYVKSLANTLTDYNFILINKEVGKIKEAFSNLDLIYLDKLSSDFFSILDSAIFFDTTKLKNKIDLLKCISSGVSVFSFDNFKGVDGNPIIKISSDPRESSAIIIENHTNIVAMMDGIEFVKKFYSIKNTKDNIIVSKITSNIKKEVKNKETIINLYGGYI